MNKELATRGFMNIVRLLYLIQFLLTPDVSCSHGVTQWLYGTGWVYLIVTMKVG